MPFVVFRISKTSHIIGSSIIQLYKKIIQLTTSNQTPTWHVSFHLFLTHTSLSTMTIAYSHSYSLIRYTLSMSTMSLHTPNSPHSLLQKHRYSTPSLDTLFLNLCCITLLIRSKNLLNEKGAQLKTIKLEIKDSAKWEQCLKREEHFGSGFNLGGVF